MESLAKRMLGVLAVLIGIPILLFGVIYSGMGLIMWQLCRASIASGDPDASPMVIGVLAIVGGSVLCCMAWPLLRGQVRTALFGAVVGLMFGVALIPLLERAFHLSGLERLWEQWPLVAVPLAIWIPMAAGAVIATATVWARERH